MLIYNTRTHKKQEFEPIEQGKVRMYVCGPTVYDQIHIGNARTFLSFDVIRRYLEHKGYEVIFAQNLTDVDDKIINRANEEGRSAAEVAEEYSDAFIEQMARLGVAEPTIRPRATQEIDAMLEMIESLIEQDSAYVVGGDVYFSVRSCHNYGTVSGRNVDDLRVGARVEENTDKHDPLDFALWKSAKPGEPSWKSPWGEGRPGWHTECCAMIHHYLGCPIDIHGGGADLVFPHHENESAQASCAWHEPLANYWMHAGMLTINEDKMSKSLGNFYTLKEVLDSYPAEALRLLALQTHYRSPLDFSFQRLEGMVGSLERLRGAVSNLRWAAEQTSEQSTDHDATLEQALEQAKSAFVASMDDDFNTAGALAEVFGLVSAANSYLDATGNSVNPELARAAAELVCELLAILGINLEQESSALPAELVELAALLTGYTGESADEAAQLLLDKRSDARASKDWSAADAIRDGITALGLVVEDTAAGPRLKSAE